MRAPAEVTVYRAADLYDEAEFVAASIRNLVMEEGYHYGDFTIIARHPEEYASMLEESWAGKGDPSFHGRSPACGIGTVDASLCSLLCKPSAGDGGRKRSLFL